LRADHPLLAYALTGKGQSLLELDRRADAIAPLERALTLRSTQDGDANELAHTQFILARALEPEPDTRARALELGQTALETMRELGTNEKERAEIEAWLAARGAIPHAASLGRHTAGIGID